VDGQSFAHVGLVCRDPIAVERFYTKHFGFRRTRVIEAEGDQIVFIKAGGLALEIFAATQASPVSPAGGAGPEYPGWRHLAFQVGDVDAKLAEMGDDAQVTLGPFSFDDVIPGWRTAWIADPEGNIIEITQGYADQQNPPPLED
jgi:glyoxylase I family protein